MARRSHHKSRRGCKECKRRHIKCDETRPICSNCISSERDCHYALPQDALKLPIDPPSSRSSRSLDSHSLRASSEKAPEHIGVESPNQYPSVNMRHAELFYHLSTATFDSFRSELAAIHVSYDEIFKQVISAPYLMNELLALAAIHLSTQNTDRRDLCRHEATQLQTHALSIFNKMKPEINTETCIPMFLFSSVLGMHEMCETFVFRETGFEQFLDKFIRYISLHRGVKIITSSSWKILNDSALGPFLKHEETVTPLGAVLGNICSQLLELVKAQLSETSSRSCEQALSSLQSVLSMTPSDAQVKVSFNAVLAWPVIVCPGYIDLLKQREPHSLIILAHYAALVHLRHDMWIFGDGGQVLVDLISQHLGDQWSDWLVWPNEVVSSSRMTLATS